MFNQLTYLLIHSTSGQASFDNCEQVFYMVDAILVIQPNTHTRQ